MPARYLVGIAAVLFFLSSCQTNKVRPAFTENGAQWLSWSPNQRNRYVFGFIDGYLLARHTACVAADDLFEVGQPHRMGDEQHPTDYPSGRCLAAVDQYSRFKFTNSMVDISTYVNPITEFYTKYPKYREIPVPTLMESLSDKRSSTAQELFAMAANGKIQIPH